MKTRPITTLTNVLGNRQFTFEPDGWFHVAPIGEFEHSSGVKQVIDSKSVEAMTNNFKTDAQAENFPGILLDIDHFSHNPDKESAAAGWITDMKNDAKGLWVKIRWSDLGESAVKGGRYRLVSPVWNRADCEELGDDKVRPLRLNRVALTNDPNLKGLTPLSNRQHETTLPDSPANLPAEILADIQNKETNTMKKIATTLGLSAEASEEAILGGLTKLQNRAKEADQIPALTKQRDELKNRVATIEDDQAEADLNAAGIPADHADRATIKSILLSNRDGGLAMLKLAKTPATARAPMTNRATAKTPGSDLSDAVKNRSSEQVKLVEAIRIQNKCSNTEAWNLAERQNPELFREPAPQAA